MRPDIKTLEAAAAGWVVRREAGLMPGEEAEFVHWLEADPENAAVYRAVESAWSGLDGVADSAFGAQLEAELEHLPDPGEARIIRPGRRAWLTGSLAAAAAIAIAWVAWRPNAETSNHFATTTATEVGGGRTMTLPDGSTIELNTDTFVDVQFSRARRGVRLMRGEALFTVAHDASRPFVVTARGVDVRAVGTAFNVRLHTAAVEVIVTDGKVRVDQPADSLADNAHADRGSTRTESHLPAAGLADIVTPLAFIGAGERAMITVGAIAVATPVVEVAAIPATDMDRALAWQERRLIFVSAPLSEIATEFNRYNRKKIVIDDPELAGRRFGGTFQANDPLTFIDLLRVSYGVVVSERHGVVVLHSSDSVER